MTTGFGKCGLVSKHTKTLNYAKQEEEEEEEER